MIRIHASNNINTSRHGSNNNKPFEPLSTSIDLEHISRNVNDWINAATYMYALIYHLISQNLYFVNGNPI